MGLAIAAPNITFGADVANVKVPTLLVAGGSDETSPQSISEAAFDQISTEDKAFVPIPKAEHRSFDSTYCDQVQAAGTDLDKDGDGDLSELDKTGDGEIKVNDFDTNNDKVVNPGELAGFRASSTCTRSG